MATVTKARAHRSGVKNAEGLPIEYDDVMLPLGRAKAALWLLGSELDAPEEHEDWIRSICLDVVLTSIEETEREYAKKAGAVPDTKVVTS
jgi:hypothetical protein